MTDIIIFGTGEYAALAHYYFTHDPECVYNVVGFTADDAYIDNSEYRGLPLIPVSEVENWFPPDRYKGHVALSYSKLNRTRQTKYDLMKSKGYELVSYVCSKSVTWPDLNVGDNCFILENQTIQPTVTIGNNVMIWSGNHLGHGCQIKDHAYVSSHVCIAGHVIVGERCFLGVNSAIADFITVGDDCFIGMGANVVNNLNDGDMILCAKSGVFDKDHALNNKIIDSYFGK